MIQLTEYESRQVALLFECWASQGGGGYDLGDISSLTGKLTQHLAEWVLAEAPSKEKANAEV